jgi:hypothetical protein
MAKQYKKMKLKRNWERATNEKKILEVNMRFPLKGDLYTYLSKKA